MHTYYFSLRNHLYTPACSPTSGEKYLPEEAINLPGICPVCNGLTPLTTACAYCLAPLLDYGQLESYLDPYAPFEEDELLHQSQTSVYEGYCQHLAYCGHCHRQVSVPVELIPAPDNGYL